MVDMSHRLRQIYKGRRPTCRGGRKRPALYVRQVAARSDDGVDGSSQKGSTGSKAMRAATGAYGGGRRSKTDQMLATCVLAVWWRGSMGINHQVFG